MDNTAHPLIKMLHDGTIEMSPEVRASLRAIIREEVAIAFHDLMTAHHQQPITHQQPSAQPVSRPIPPTYKTGGNL